MVTSANAFLWGKLAFVSEQEAPLGPFRGRTNTCVEQQIVPPVGRTQTNRTFRTKCFLLRTSRIWPLLDVINLLLHMYVICNICCKEVVLHITIAQLGFWLPSVASDRGETNHREGFSFNSSGFVLQSKLRILLSLNISYIILWLNWEETLTEGINWFKFNATTNKNDVNISLMSV